jgi:ABC-type transport system substrate-binding protein
MHFERVGILVNINMFDSLLHRSTKLEFEPSLATSWKALSDTQWEFKIRKGVRFHNGEIMTPADVKYSFDRVIDPAKKSPQYGNVRAIKEVGWVGLSVNTALTPMSNMGQQLYEPPDVNGWEAGPGWVSTSGMLTRMNFASTLAANQRFNLARDLQPYRQTPERVMEYMNARFRTMGFAPAQTTAMIDYLKSTPWTGTDAQLQQRIPGLTRLMVGSGEYVFN